MVTTANANIFSTIASVAAVNGHFKLKTSKVHTLYYLRKRKMKTKKKKKLSARHSIKFVSSQRQTKSAIWTSENRLNDSKKKQEQQLSVTHITYNLNKCMCMDCRWLLNHCWMLSRWTSCMTWPSGPFRADGAIVKSTKATVKRRTLNSRGQPKIV